MKKFTKTLLTLGLLVGGLAGCGDSSVHTVTFWLTDTAFHSEAEVKSGKKVEEPAEPTRTGYVFEYWAEKVTEGEEVVAQKYDFATKVKADLDLYAQWKVAFSADTNRYTLVGDLKNTDYADHKWSEEASYVDLEMKETDPTDEKNEFAITVDLGYNAEIKVKSLVDGWDDNFNWGDGPFVMDDPANYGPKSEDGKGNLIIKNAGNYTITLTTVVVNGVTMGDQSVIHIVRNGDPLDPEKVTANPEEGATVAWRLTGDLPQLGIPYWDAASGPVFEGEATDHVYSYGPVYLSKGQEFKLTKEGAWEGAAYGAFPAEVFGAGEKYVEKDTIPEGSVVGDPKPGSNNVVLENGFYVFTISADDPSVDREELTWKFEVSHGLLQVAGDMNGWGDLGHDALNLLTPAEGDPVVVAAVAGTEEVPGTPETHTYTLKGEVVVANDESGEPQEWKIRTYGDGGVAELGADAEGTNFKLAAGTYEFEVELVITYGAEAFEYALTFVKTPALKA